jgi:hypothetical protein
MTLVETRQIGDLILLRYLDCPTSDQASGVLGSKPC